MNQLHNAATAAEMSPCLRVQGVYKAVKQKQILRDIHLYVGKGEVVALLGPNGAGKTSCFHAITGLVSVDKGDVRLDQHDVSHWPMYRRCRAGLGYLPQEASIFRGLTVAQNIRAVLEVAERDRQTVQQRLSQLLSDFGLERVQHSPAPALSGGERRRAELARALASNPRYMLLDEPFAGVDPIAVHDVRMLVTTLKQRGMGVLITDHNVREALALVDRAYIMFDGQILTHGTPQEIVAHPDVRRVYLGENFQLN